MRMNAGQKLCIYYARLAKLLPGKNLAWFLLHCNFHANAIGIVLACICNFHAKIGQKIDNYIGMVLACAFAFFGQKIDKYTGTALAFARSVPK